MKTIRNEIPRVDICTLSEYRQDDIIVSRFSEYLSQHYSHLAAPHRHSFYHMVFFTEGTGKHTIDFNHFQVQPYQIYFMVPGQVHSWNFEGKVDGYVVNFSTGFFQSFLLRPDYIESFSFLIGDTQKSVINLSDHTRDSIVALFEKLVDQSQLDFSLGADMIRLLLLQIFIQIEQEYFSDDKNNLLSQNNVLLRNFRKLIERNFLELKLPGEYAELLYISPNHLNALCKDHLGMQAGELVRERVLLEAKRLLVNMDVSISEIAYKLNFNDNSYFTKFFKKEVGITPDAFRKKLTATRN